MLAAQEKNITRVAESEHVSQQSLSNQIKKIEDEKKKLQTKLSLIIEQLDVMEKAQEDAAKIQDKIAALDGDKDESKKDQKN